MKKSMKRSISILLTFILTVIAAVGTISPAQAQPEAGGFTIDYESAQVDYNGHMYQVIHTPDGKWSDVAAYARAQGGYLASLTDGEEDVFAYLFMQENGFDSIYFGFSDELSEGMWLWESGEETSYTNWNPSEPNNQGAYEHYAMYYKGSAGWNDGSGVGECAYLIEWDASAQAAVPEDGPGDEVLPSVANIQAEFYRQLQTIDLKRKEGIHLAVDDSLPAEIRKGQMILPSGDIVYIPDLTRDLCVDEETGISYINNEILVVTSSDLSQEMAQMLAMRAGGKIAGDISQTSNILQMVIPQTDLQSIEEICLKLMENDDVLFASSDYMVPIEDNEVELTSDRSQQDSPAPGTDDDRVWEDENEDAPEGLNWWAEAIGAYSGWKKLDAIPGFRPAPMATLEGSVGCQHPDLPENSTYQPPYAEGWHNTMVLGCMEALDNGRGIRGTAAAGDASSAISWSYSMPCMMLFTSWFLIQNSQLLDAGVKVINNSWGLKFSSGFETVVLEFFALNQCGLLTAFIVGRELSGHGDFLLVQTAGNNANQSYWNAGWASITPLTASSNPILSLETAKLGLLFQLALSVSVYPVAKEHIVIVSACKNECKDGIYTYWEDSGYGNYVDICAPGHNILSTAAGDGYTYQQASGTSLSAPMVTGVIADIWGINSSLSAAEVKGILTTSCRYQAQLNKDGKEYITPMLDMKSAIEAALKTEGALQTAEDVPEKKADAEVSSTDILAELSGYYFSAGSLAWTETLEIGENGSFTGSYLNDNLGNYNGQMMTERWYSAFHGTFSEARQIDDCTWSLKVSDFAYDFEPGTDEVRDNIHYVYTDEHLIGSEMYLYLPGHNLTDVPTGFPNLIQGKFNGDELSCYAIFSMTADSLTGVFTS